MTLHAVFVGRGPLLLACARAWLQRGHRVAALAGDCPQVAAWARETGLALVPRSSDLPAALNGTAVDYLFSVVHHALVTPEVLACARHGGINFHDSLLPQGAGFHAGTWALLEGRTEHGITWHRMAAEADAGAVLLQRRFSIGAGDTAFTLSARAAQVAAEAFGALVAQLEAGPPAAGSGQAPPRVRRKSERPAPVVVGANATCPQVLRWLRALDTGPEDNWLARVALLTPSGERVLVGQAQPLTLAAAPAGTLAAVYAGGLHLHLADGALALEDLTTPEGDALDAAALAGRGCAPGARLPVLADAAALAALDAALTRHERHWVAAWARNVPPAALGLALPPQPGPALQQAVPLADAVQALPAPEQAATLLAALALYAARCAGDGEMPSLGWGVEDFDAAHFGAYAPVVPVAVDAPLASNAAAWRAAACAALARARACRTHARDAWTRYAALRALPAERRRLPVAVAAEDGPLRPGVQAQFACSGGALRLRHDSAALAPEAAHRLAARVAALMANLATAAGAEPVARLPLPTAEEARRLRHDFQPAPTAFDARCVHQLFEAQAARTPDTPALVFRDQRLSYRELDRRANALAHRLHAAGVGPGRLVGLSVERSLEMVVGLLAILKAGGAYVPLDPAYPPGRLALMLEDSQARWLVTQPHLAGRFPGFSGERLFADPGLAPRDEPPAGGATPEDLAYVIFTSGSTGRPKGVMVEHRNVANFFAGMDAVLGTAPGTWLAVTSISFDISVLELFWTLSRGFTVVVQEEADRSSQQRRHAAPAPGSVPARPMGFGLFYFAADSTEAAAQDRRTVAPYRLLLEGARFADTHDFVAVWTPERHFHAFGGLYPNPAVTSAAVAAVTQRVELRAGSVVLPLHDPLRVAEEWAVVDNLSQGRVGLSFASGWHANDFVLQPQNYEHRHAALREGIATVRTLWAGGTVRRRNGEGEDIEVSVLPRPVRERPPMWIASAGNAQTFRAAGQDGHHVLTNLLGQGLEELQAKIAAYREARRAAGHAGEGIVSVMLHTFVTADDDEARRLARGPFGRYLRSSYDLVKVAPWMFPAFKRPGATDGSAFDAAHFDEADIQALLDHAFERYFDTAGLFGTPERALGLVQRLRAIGVDEVACLIDFGIEPDVVLRNLEHLDRLRRLANALPAPAPVPAPAPTPDQAPDATLPVTVAEQFRRHAITHLQCTPSLARMLAADGTLAAMGPLRRFLLGGEALPPELAATLQQALPATRLVNLYGPTETTVWSTAGEVVAGQAVTIGRPIANTRIRIVDAAGELLPPGMPGELCIGGAGVVRGYLQRPDLTAERFVADPDVPGGRLYRTGDLARWRDDGRIDYLGRIDQQVKFNGYRIELGEIESLLARHPAVRQAVVAVKAGAAGPQLVGYLLPQGGDAAATVQGWGERWDQAYRHRAGQAPGAARDPRFDTSGWLSSIDGEPLPTEAMREWLDGTLARLRALAPRRVLEIGCGTGMLLFGLLPAVQHYTALDVSAAALEAIRGALTPAEAARVTLLQRPAHELDALPSHGFDLVVINSVAQYFPDATYLLRVFDAAARLLEDGGALFLGDVRSLEQARAFHAQVALAAAPPDLPAAELAERIRERAAHEGELLLGAGWVALAAREVPRLRLASVQLRSGRHANEMRDYRQDMVWRAGPHIAPLAPEALPALEAPADPGALLRALAAQPPLLLARGLHNARLAAMVRVLAEVEGGSARAEALRTLAAQPAGGIEPDALRTLDPAYDVELRFAARLGEFDALFRRRGVAPPGPWLPAAGPEAAASAPHRERLPAAALGRALRTHLKAQLPDFMLPTAWVVVEAFPLTPNGKIDRNALPAPQAAAPAPAAAAAPANALEATLAGIWCALLGVEQVSRSDNLFDLGASSLLTVEANNRLQQALGRKIPLVAMFRHPTIESLAAHLAQHEAGAAPDTPPADDARQDRLAAAAERRRQARNRLGTP